MCQVKLDSSRLLSAHWINAYHHHHHHHNDQQDDHFTDAKKWPVFLNFQQFNSSTGVCFFISVIYNAQWFTLSKALLRSFEQIFANTKFDCYATKLLTDCQILVGMLIAWWCCNYTSACTWEQRHTVTILSVRLSNCEGDAEKNEMKSIPCRDKTMRVTVTPIRSTFYGSATAFLCSQAEPSRKVLYGMQFWKTNDNNFAKLLL